jgi:hypothetical protein
MFIDPIEGTDTSNAQAATARGIKGALIGGLARGEVACRRLREVGRPRPTVTAAYSYSVNAARTTYRAIKAQPSNATASPSPVTCHTASAVSASAPM